jgi:hypothetical protein
MASFGILVPDGAGEGVGGRAPVWVRPGATARNAAAMAALGWDGESSEETCMGCIFRSER